MIGREREVDEGPMAGVSPQEWPGLRVAGGGSEHGKNIAVLQVIAPGGGRASQMDEQRPV